MDFSNGLYEEEHPLLAPALPTSTTPASTASTSHPAARAQGHDDTLDLTEDSPEPEIKAPSHHRGAGGPRRARDSRAPGGGDGGTQGHRHSSGRVQGGAAGHGGDTGTSAALDWAAVVGASRSPLSTAPGGGGLGSVSSPGAFAAYAGPAAPPLLPPQSQGSSRLTYTPYRPVPSSSSSAPLGRIPVISSAVDARMPSAYLHGPTSSGRAPHPSAPFIPPRPSPAKGKGRADDVLDLTADDGDIDVYAPPAPAYTKPEPVSDDDDVVIDESPVCLGDVFTFGLVLNRVTEILPPPPPPTQFADGTPVPSEQLAQMQVEYERAKKAFSCPLPVHIRRDQPTYNQGQWREMLRLYTPVRHEMFGFVDYKAADVLGPLLGEGWHGTGITQGGNGKLYCEAFVERVGQQNVRHPPSFSQRARTVTHAPSAPSPS